MRPATAERAHWRATEVELRKINSEQLSRLVEMELLRLRVADLERALHDMEAARDSLREERDKLHQQHYDLLARLRAVGGADARR